MSSVSVIMSTYRRNHGTTTCSNMLKRAIDSILAQTFQDFELILIDDGSTDGSEAICREYAARDGRIRYVRHEQNSGRSAKRYNEGMLMARADYFMFMFDDDMWLPNAVADLYGAITGEHKNCGLVYGQVNITNGDQTDILGSEWNVNLQRNINLLGNLSVIVKREAINAVGGYDDCEILTRTCDWDLWYRIGLAYPVALLPVLVGSVWVLPDGIGSTVPLDYAAMKRIQRTPNRLLPLKGQLNKPGEESRNGFVKRIVFVCSGHDGGLVRWALQYLCDSVRNEGINADIVDLAKVPNYWEPAVDAMLIYRSYDLKALHLLRRIKQQGKFVMFFLDDYLFQPNCKYTGTWKMPMEPLLEADCLVSSSARLLSHMPDKLKILRRTVADAETMSILKQDYRRSKNVFNIGWLAGVGRRGLMDRFVYDILWMLDAMLPIGMTCTFHCFGNRDYPQMSKVSVKEHPYMKFEDWRGLYAKWTTLDLGCVINPLEEDDEFCHCKSALKYVESGAMGVPMITSRVAPYTEFVQEGVNGFFASTPKEYVEKIIKLLMDEPLSRKVSAACYDYVVKNCDVQENARKFIADVEEAMAKTADSRVKQHFGWTNALRKPW